MASIHRQIGRPFWFCAFTSSDGTRLFRSTKTRDKKQALEICRAWARAANLGRTGRLTVDAARGVIAAGVADVFAAVNLATLPTATIQTWCDTWLGAKAIETESSTHARYTRIMERFGEFLASKAARNIATLQAVEITRFRDREANALSRATANLSLKVLRVCFGEAVKQGILTVNPASRVPVLKARGESKRRAFTVPEIKRIIAACGEDVEWRGLVLFGLYIGQRLGDLARLTWRAVDLQSPEIAFTTRKGGRRIVLPLMAPLVEYLEALPAGDDPDAFIFPTAAATTRTGTLSNRFREILVSAGLASPRTHRATEKGRDTSRETSELSFHSLRHSAVTLLKAAGVSDAMAREIVGHESAAVSRGYTHLATEDLRRAMNKVADVTKRTK